MEQVDAIEKRLAALLYYQQNPVKKGEPKPAQFEKLEDDKQKPFLELSRLVLVCLDQMDIKLIQKSKVKNQVEIEELLRARIEAAVAEFFAKVKIWKKDLIPQQELVAKIYQVWGDL